jgi:hypothetical protein
MRVNLVLNQDFERRMGAAYRGCMGACFDDNTTFADDEKGVPICYDWLRDQTDEPRAPIRVQVKQSFVEREWGLSWKEPSAVMQRFDAVKRQHVDAAMRAKQMAKADYCVYTIE